MIETIKISNFQSLRNVDIELGNFTVIVGPSSSGKSALTRALKAVASNALDSDYITRGTKLSSVSVKTDSGTVTIERSGNTSAYKVAKVGSQESSFTRLNRQVPTEVTEILGIAPSTKEIESINFAGQFDAPYLLKDGSSTVARVLGELTNVSTIFAAVKEASKRAKNSSSLLNLRKKDLDEVKKQITDYRNVTQETQQLAEIEMLISTSVQTEASLRLLKTLVGRAEVASDALSGVKIIPEVPDMDELIKAQNNLTRFKNLLREINSAKSVRFSQGALVEQADETISEIDIELHDTLVQAGNCPLCNQKTGGLL